MRMIATVLVVLMSYTASAQHSATMCNQVDTLWVMNLDKKYLEFGCALHGEQELNGILLTPGKWVRIERRHGLGDSIYYYIAGRYAPADHGYLHCTEQQWLPGQFMITVKWNDQKKNFEISCRRRDAFDRPEYVSSEQVQ